MTKAGSPQFRAPPALFVFCRMPADVRRLERRHCCAENDARLVVRAFLHHDGGCIDPIGIDLGQRDRPGRVRATPVAELYLAPHDIVVGDRPTAIFATVDVNGHCALQRA